MNGFGPFVIGLLVAIGMGGCGMLSFVMSQSWKGNHTTQMVSAVNNLTLLMGIGIMGALFIFALGLIFIIYGRLQSRSQQSALYTGPQRPVVAEGAPSLPPVKNPGTWMSNRNRNVQEIEGDFYELD